MVITMTIPSQNPWKGQKGWGKLKGGVGNTPKANVLPSGFSITNFANLKEVEVFIRRHPRSGVHC